MNARQLATLNFQAPELQAPPYGYRPPDSLTGKNVCCRCKREVTTYAFITQDGHRIETHHCPEHGDVPPMRSHIVNGESTR